MAKRLADMTVSGYNCGREPKDMMTAEQIKTFEQKRSRIQKIMGERDYQPNTS